MIRKSQRGIALAMAILIMLVLGVLIPMIIRMVQKDAKDTVKSGLKTLSLQVAEAGQDRGAWKLRESDVMWSTAAAGATISDYHDDKVYTDVAGGEYKILITSGPTVGTVA